MKKRVIISIGSAIFSVVILIVFLGIIIFLVSREGVGNKFMVACGALCILLLAALFYSAISISADDSGIWVNRLLHRKFIPYSNIESVELMQPTMGEQQIIGSKGFMGYWGWLAERDLGKYFAYYGKASDCFFVRTNSGKNYMLGCVDPEEMVDFLKKRIQKRATAKA